MDLYVGHSTQAMTNPALREEVDRNDQIRYQPMIKTVSQGCRKFGIQDLGDGGLLF